MNGRLYDPETGRFLQADPIIGSALDSQSYNRYSYVLNNPLMYTDPSGYRYEPSGWVKGRDKYAIPVITAIISVIACNVGAVGCYATISAASAVFTTLYRGGSISDALKAGLFSLASSALFYGAGQAADGIASEAIDAYLRGEITHTTMQALVGAFGDGALALGRIALHAAAGCISSAMSGGECGSGAAGAAVGKALQLAGSATEFGQSKLGGLIVATIGGCAGGAAASRGSAGEGCAGGAAQAVAGYLFNALAGSYAGGFAGAAGGAALCSGLGPVAIACAMAGRQLGRVAGSAIEDWVTGLVVGANSDADKSKDIVLWHGTDARHALALKAGVPLSISEATAFHIDGKIGFYLADNEAAAEFFAVRRPIPAVIQFTVSSQAVANLITAGAVFSPIPQGTGGSFVPGNQLYLPPNAFPVWDTLIKSGGIR